MLTQLINHPFLEHDHDTITITSTLTVMTTPSHRVTQ